MRFMYWGKDGGPESTVWGFWPIELKKLFSVAILKFVGASRPVYHDHAFSSVSWLLKGKLVEESPDGAFKDIIYTPSWKPIITSRNRFHKVDSKGISWVLTFRGPWRDNWREFDPYIKSPNHGITRLTHGREKVVTYR